MVRTRLESDGNAAVVLQILADPEGLTRILPTDALKDTVIRLLFRLEGMEKREKWSNVEAAAVAALTRSGNVEDFLPFFLGAFFRRNLALLEYKELNVFPKSIASLKVLQRGRIPFDTSLSLQIKNT